MKTFLTLVVLIFTTINSFSQMPDFSKTVQDSMQKVSVMPGHWEGDGWTLNRTGEKKLTSVSENMSGS